MITKSLHFWNEVTRYTHVEEQIEGQCDEVGEQKSQ